MNKVVYLLVFLFGTFIIGCSGVETIVHEQSDGEQALNEAISAASNVDIEGDVLYFVVFIDPTYKLVQAMKLPTALALKKKELHDKILAYETRESGQTDQAVVFNNDRYRAEALEGLRQEMLAIRGRVSSLSGKQAPTDVKEGMLLDKVKSEGFEGEISESECKYVVFK